MLEFIAIYNNSEGLKRRVEKIKTTKDFKIKNFTDRTAYYALYENFHKCEFLFDVKGRRKLSELSKKWNIKRKEKVLKENLKDKDIFVVDMTPREIKKTNIRIVRSYSPDLLDLEADETALFNCSFKRKRIDKIDKIFKTKTKIFKHQSPLLPLRRLPCQSLKR